MSATEAGKLYNALKLHFNNEEYDFVKYHGKTSIKFIPENQIYTFQKLQNRYGETLKEFYISNFVENPKIWVNDLPNQESDDVYRSWLKKKESLSYVFRTDVSNILENQEDINDVLRVKKDFPILMKMVLQKKVNIETLLIMDNIVKFFSVWDKRIKDELIWKSFRMKCIKYRPFLEFEPDKMKYILKQEVKRLL